MEIIKLGIEEDIKEVKIGTGLKDTKKGKMIKLLHEYVDVFTWSYQYMPKLDIDILVHKLPLKEQCPLVKRKLRITLPDMSLKIK